MNAVDFISELGETSPVGGMCIWWGLFVVCSIHLLIHSAQPVFFLNCFYLAIIIDSYAAVRNNVDSWTWWRSLVAPGGLWLESSLGYTVRHCHHRPPKSQTKPNQVPTNNNSKIMCVGMCPLPSVLMTTSCSAQYMHVRVWVWGWVQYHSQGFTTISVTARVALVAWL